MSLDDVLHTVFWPLAAAQVFRLLEQVYSDSTNYHLGKEIVEALNQLDIPVVMGSVIVIAFLLFFFPPVLYMEAVEVASSTAVPARASKRDREVQKKLDGDRRCQQKSNLIPKDAVDSKFDIRV